MIKWIRSSYLGTKQESRCARAWNPDIALDEPTSALDPEIRRSARRDEELMTGGMTMVVITHEVGFAVKG